uniref:Uncharacterized protein n=1 Tax=Trichobilharzia regenti TaxID=157069 RepID=A0AA85K8C9_TRIRE|nr:unnamed protein product [Trichobilharzia regenti]
MFIIRLASDALSSITEGEPSHQMHQTASSPSTSQYESLKKIEDIPKQPNDDTQKRLLSIKRVHRLIEEELMMEYDMKATNKSERYNNSNNNNNIKLSRYHEKDEFCTPYSSSNQRSKNDASVKRNTADHRSISTPKKCSPTTSLLYDLLSGRENFNSVYMRSQLVFVTCDDDNVEPINNFTKEGLHSKRKTTRGPPLQRRRKPLRPTKHFIALRTPEKSTDTDGKHFPRNAASIEKLSSSSPFSLSPSSTSSPSSSSSSLSSSVLSPSNINMLTCSQASPKKLLDKIDCLTINNTTHSQSPIDHSSLLSIINNQECLEQPLDLSSASHSYRLGLPPNNQSDMIEIKRRRSFAGNSRLSDNSDVIKCSTQRHNSVNLPLSTKKIDCNRKNSVNINTTTTSNSRPERKPSEKYPCLSNGPEHTEKFPMNISNTESNALTTNFLDFILSPDCYRVALSAALAICASSVFQSLSGTLDHNNSNSNNSDNNNNNNLLNSRNTPKTTYELAYDILNSLNSNSGGTTSSVKQENEQQHQQQQQCLKNTSPTSADNSSYPSVVNTQDCQHSVVSTSKIPLCKSNSMSKYNTTGDNFPPKKSLSNRLYSIKKVNQADYLNKTHSLPSRTLNQHSSSDNNNSSNSNNNNNNNFDTDIVDIITTRHSFTSSSPSSSSSSTSSSSSPASSPMKVPSEDLKLFFRRNSSRYRGRIRYWLIQMISLVKQPEPILISLLHNNDNNNNSNDKMTDPSNIPVEQMTSLLSCFRLHILDQSIETRLKFLNMSWYRLLLVYLIEHKQLDLLTIESALSSSSASASSTDGNEGNDERSTHRRCERNNLINNNKEIKSIHQSTHHQYHHDHKMSSLLHDIQTVTSMCYSLEFNHSVYNLIRIGLLIIGDQSDAQNTNNIQLLERTLQEYMVNLNCIKNKSKCHSNLSLNGCITETTTSPTATNTTTTTITSTSTANTPTKDTDSNAVVLVSSSSNNSRGNRIPSVMIHTIIQKLLKVTKDSIIFLLSNQLGGDSVESMYNSLVEISKVS